LNRWLKQVRRRPEEIFAGIFRLIMRGRFLRECDTRPQDHSGKEAGAENDPGHRGRVAAFAFEFGEACCLLHGDAIRGKTS
jgi:hypothetical protein